MPNQPLADPPTVRSPAPSWPMTCSLLEIKRELFSLARISHVRIRFHLSQRFCNSGCVLLRGDKAAAGCHDPSIAPSRNRVNSAYLWDGVSARYLQDPVGAVQDREGAVRFSYKPTGNGRW